MSPATLIPLLLNYSRRLKFRNLFLLAAGLFVLDLIIPDFIPFIDEILLGLLTIILGRWKKEEPLEKKDESRNDTIIEGEVIHEENDQK
jgi:hypothetical protein